MKLASLFTIRWLLPLLIVLFPLAYGATLLSGEDKVRGEECYVNLNVRAESVPLYEFDNTVEYIYKGLMPYIAFEVQKAVGYRAAAFDDCEKAFAAGDAESGFWLAEYLVYYHEIEEAKYYYEKAAAAGDARALYALARWGLFSKDKEFDIEAAEAFDYLQQAAEKGFAKAESLYSSLLRYTEYTGVSEDQIQILKSEYVHRAAEKGDFKAMSSLAHIYLYFGSSGACMSKPDLPDKTLKKIRADVAVLNIACDEEKGLHYLTEAARSGMAPEAILELAQYYEAKGEVEQALYWHSLFWEWDYEDYFYANMYGLSWTFADVPIDYRRLCDLQHKSEAYMKQHSPSGGIIIDTEQLAQIESGYKTYACQYQSHSWYYPCRKET